MIRKVYPLVILILVCTTCDKIESLQDNPLDPGNPDYESPIVNIISGPGGGETISTSEATFIWEGNDLVSEYRTSFLNDPWGDWADHTLITLQYLDEDNYSFSVQGRYSSGDTSAVVSNNFTVDAVQGPALMFYPRANYSSVGSNVTFQILAEEVENLTAVEFSVTYNNSIVTVLSITQGTMFTGNGESIFHSDFNNNQGSLSVLMGMLGGNSPSVSGTGVLAEVTLGILSDGSSNLSFDGSEILKDPQNNLITLNTTVNGLVVVE